jgi:hypothetical protein
MQQANKLTEAMAFNNQALQECADSLVSISTDPARFGEAGRTVDGSRSQIMLWSLFA